MAHKVIGVIPARYESTRLPKKMLRDINGRSLIELVYENTKKAKKLDDVIVATDHEAIKEKIEASGGKAVLTDPNHHTGTDRIVEVVQDLDCTIVVNIQGDEPFLDPEAIDSLVEALENDSDLKVATLCFRVKSKSIHDDPHVVKVLFDQKGYALYFSRSPIPYYREPREDEICFKHFGIYAFRKDFLLHFAKLPPSFLESAEKLEQLRILESGERIKVLEAKQDSLGIDTEEDLQKAIEIHQKRIAS